MKPNFAILSSYSNMKPDNQVGGFLDFYVFLYLLKLWSLCLNTIGLFDVVVPTEDLYINSQFLLRIFLSP